MFIDQETNLRVNIYAQYKEFSKLDTPEIRAKAGVIEIAEPTLPEDYSEDTYYRIEQDAAPYVVFTRKSDEQIAEVMRRKAKEQRAEMVERIVVTTKSGKRFDGDEESQGRMARAITALDPGETQLWVLADNTPDPNVTREELREALRLAGSAQTTVWATPYAS